MLPMRAWKLVGEEDVNFGERDEISLPVFQESTPNEVVIFLFETLKRTRQCPDQIA